MNKFLTATALSLALGLGLASTAGAQQTNDARGGEAMAQQRSGADQPATTVQPGAAGQAVTQPSAAGEAWYGELSADDLIGRDVVNQNGEDVGDIEDIVLDSEGNAIHAVVSVGGFLGMGAKDVAIPFDQLQLGQGEAILMSEQSEEQLKEMPEFDKDRYKPIERGERLGTYGTDRTRQ